MRDIIDIYPYDYPPVSKRSNNLESIERYLSDFWGREALVLGSGRSGVLPALHYYGLKRWDHILIPDFLCQAMIHILNKSSFTVKHLDDRTKAIFLFHQWGYPQDMDKILPRIRERNLLVIEDCAHGFDSTYKGQKIGTFGKVAIFSFAKLFTTYIGGTIISADAGFIQHLRKERQGKNSVYNWLFNSLAFYVAKKSFEERKLKTLLDIIYFTSVHFPNISRKALGLLPADRNELLYLLGLRKNNYLFLKNNIKKDYLMIDWNEEIEVNPLCMPIFLPLSKLAVAREKLLQHKIDAEILHFDINRNMFEPNYQKCLAIPCHQQLSLEQLKWLSSVINQV